MKAKALRQCPPRQADRLYRAAKEVDRLIDDRAGDLFAGRFGGIRRGVLRKILQYDRAVRIGSHVLDQPGSGSLEFMRRYLSMNVRIEGASHIPGSGGFMMVVNHPTGIADGIVIYELLKARRPDMIFFANRDIIDVVPGLDAHIIPVEWVKNKRSPQKSRAILAAASRACRDGRAVVLFPSGRLGFMTWRGLQERPWQPTAVSLARKFDLPIVPVWLGGHNSAMFYLFSMLSNELRDITLLHELLNKRNADVGVRVGVPVDPFALPADSVDATQVLQRYVAAGLRWPHDADENEGADTALVSG